nr:hypothetical protein [Mycobacterium malmoense]
MELILNGRAKRYTVCFGDETDEPKLDEITQDWPVPHQSFERAVDKLDSRRRASQTPI